MNEKKSWIRKYQYKQPENELLNPITSISVAKSGEMVCAGATSGHIYLFERRVDGTWDNTLTWLANKEIVDVRMRKSISGIVLDTDFFTIQRKCPLLISAGLREIRIWFISDRYEPSAPIDYNPTDLTFPPISKKNRERFVAANEITLIQSSDGSFFGSVRACQDGLTFGYTESTRVVIRRVDHVDPLLVVYTNDSTLTRVDFHPTQFDLIIAGDERGYCNVVDLRIQPTQSTPTCRADASRILADRYKHVADCRFSPDGSMFFTRHFGDLLIWDHRNTSVPLNRVSVPPGVTEQSNHLSSDGKNLFRSTWIDEKSVATGWFGGEMFAFNVDGASTHLFATKNSQKSGKKFLFNDKRRQWAKDHCVRSIDMAPYGSRVAASNGGDVFIYDIVEEDK